MSVSRGEAWKRYMSRGNVFAHFYMEWSVNSLQFDAVLYYVVCRAEGDYNVGHSGCSSLAPWHI